MHEEGSTEICMYVGRTDWGFEVVRVGHCDTIKKMSS